MFFISILSEVTCVKNYPLKNIQSLSLVIFCKMDFVLAHQQALENLWTQSKKSLKGGQRIVFYHAWKPAK